MVQMLARLRSESLNVDLRSKKPAQNKHKRPFLFQLAEKKRGAVIIHGQKSSFFSFLFRKVTSRPPGRRTTPVYHRFFHRKENSNSTIIRTSKKNDRQGNCRRQVNKRLSLPFPAVSAGLGSVRFGSIGGRSCHGSGDESSSQHFVAGPTLGRGGPPFLEHGELVGLQHVCCAEWKEPPHKFHVQEQGSVHVSLQGHKPCQMKATAVVVDFPHGLLLRLSPYFW